MLPGPLLLLLALPIISVFSDQSVGRKLNVSDEAADHNATYEDQESFQDQEQFHLHWKCNTELLMLYGEFCLNHTFHTSMVELGESNWCEWDMVIGLYNDLTLCLEMFSGEARCYYPGPITQKLFMDVHQQYFSSCSSSEDEEAPESVVLTLTLLPVCIIPIAVYMVISRSNVMERATLSQPGTH